MKLLCPATMPLLRSKRHIQQNSSRRTPANTKRRVDRLTYREDFKISIQYLGFNKVCRVNQRFTMFNLSQNHRISDCLRTLWVLFQTPWLDPFTVRRAQFIVREPAYLISQRTQLLNSQNGKLVFAISFYTSTHYLT